MSRTRILLAEDDTAHQDLLLLALTDGDPDVEVRIVRSGLECLRVLRTSPRATFDCIILDFNLPDCRADLLLRLITDNHVECPTIVVSSSTDQQVVLDSMRNGCLDFLPKEHAVQGDELRKCVRRVIAKWGAAREERRKLVRRAKKLAQLAETDPLTGLGNRLCLSRLMTGRRRAIERRGGAACVMIDVDHFKAINDHYGHPCGDMVLARMGQRIMAALNPGDAGFRIGGEEFLIILGGTGQAETLLWAETFRCDIQASPFQFGPSLLPVSVSLGVAACGPGPIKPNEIAEADRALYLAKRLGRNRVCTSDTLQVDELLAHVARQDGWSIEQRLSHLLQARRESLGPTQREHLTAHSCRVANLAARLARRLGFDATASKRLWTAGLAHDLGKLLLPEEILARPRPLSVVERSLVARHGEDGARMARRLGMDESAACFIHHHHAPYDEPELGARPSDMPDGAHILAVADTWVALRSPRPYRPALSEAQAGDELDRESGRRFHPRVVAAVLDETAGNEAELTGKDVKLENGGNEDVDRATWRDTSRV